MLVSVSDFSLWAEGSRSAIAADDERALDLLDRASTLVMEEAREAGLPKTVADWDEVTAPGRAKIVVANVARRVWVNPDQELASNIAGGPSSRVTDDAAAGMTLTDSEKAMIAGVVKVILDSTADPDWGVWTLSTSRGAVESTIYLPDSSSPYSDPIVFLDPWQDPYYTPTRD